MNQLFSRWLPSSTFLAWGATTLYFGTDGRYLKYPFTLYAQIAGILLLLIGIVLAVTKPDANCCADAACSHGLSRSAAGRISTFAIVAFPLILLPFASRAALEGIQIKNRKEKQFSGILPDEYLARKQAALARPSQAGNELETEPSEPLLPGTIGDPPPLPLPTADGQESTADAEQKHPAAADTSSFEEYLQRTPEGYIIAEVLDLLYAAQDQVLRKDFEGKKVQMIVQYMPDPKASSGIHRFKGVRMFMTCCAADSRPIATLIETETPPKFPEMTWVKIIGTSTFPIEKGRRISLLKAEKIEQTSPPKDSMLY